MFDLGGYGWQLWYGLVVTIKIAFASLIVGIVFGLLGAFAKRSKSKILNAIAAVYTTVIRGIPELLIIYLIYFGGSIALSSLFRMFNPDVRFVEIDPFTSGVFALSIVFGAYATEVFRGAMQSIHPGQLEAAKAIGMSRFYATWRIFIPQTWRYALPGLGNLWLILLKDTALISVVGLDEMLRKAKIGAETTGKPFNFYFTTALIFLGLTAISTFFLHRFEKRANRGVKKV